MQLPNIKDLEKLLKMCRKQGITELTMADMSFKFGELPLDKEETEEAEQVAPIGPSAEEMLFWSSQPDPLAQRTEQ